MKGECLEYRRCTVLACRHHEGVRQNAIPRFCSGVSKPETMHRAARRARKALLRPPGRLITHLPIPDFAACRRLRSGDSDDGKAAGCHDDYQFSGHLRAVLNTSGMNDPTTSATPFESEFAMVMPTSARPQPEKERPTSGHQSHGPGQSGRTVPPPREKPRPDREWSRTR